MSRRCVRKEKMPTVKELRKMAREMKVVGISRLLKSEMLKRDDEMIEGEERKDLLCGKRTPESLNLRNDSLEIQPSYHTDVETFLEKTTTLRKEIVQELRKTRDKMEVV